ncbi:malectin domain-containing carbohydrate-binding protein [Halococcus sediminicola]|uniref:malectin domain-containing carbohydrate-binding protein n=1 Tax=Halococcus sediminicola TaxID=1264579 RepID=UPI00067992E6|nr:malectin domain-containing carbohydrate-binding protein [Halococcus sediminicola]
MRHQHTEQPTSVEADGAPFALKRRSVLQTIAALGLGSSAVGNAIAQPRGGDDDSGVPVGIQLYTLRNLPDTTLDLLRRVAAVDNNGGPGFDVVEFAGLGGANTEEINSTLDEVGVDAASAHVGLGELEGDSFQDTVDTYQAVGVDTFIVPYIDPSSIDTVAKVEALAERMNAVSENLPEGTRLGFHNHDGEFQDVGDGQTPMEVFDAALNDDVIFEIDVGWVLTAGYDPVEVIQQYSDRTELIHMKDMEDSEFREIGEGAVDMSEVAETARMEANVDYLIYEHDQPTDPAGSTGTGAGVLSFLDGESGLECLSFADVGAPDYDDSLSGVEMGDSADSDGVPTGIQLYTLRDLPDSTAEIIRRIGSVDNNGGPGYDTVEFYTLGSSTVSEVQTALDETGLTAPSAHIGLPQLEGESLQNTLDTYGQLGVTNFIDPSLRLPDDPSVQDVENLAQRFNDVAANLPDGSRVGFHNHSKVFDELDDGRPIIEVLDENLNDGIVFEIDVGWVLTAGRDPAEIIQQYSERTEMLHMKDMENGNFAEIGEGAVDWEEVSRVAREEAVVDYIFYEHDAPSNPAGSVGTGAGALSFLDGAPGLECLTIDDIGGPGYDGDLSGSSGPGAGDDTVSVPFGYDAGGGEIDDIVSIDGLEFVDSSPAVEAYGDASVNGTAVDTGATSNPIEGTEHDALYQSEEWGGDLSYDVSIENGMYDVTLYFAEIYFGGDFGGGQIDGGVGSRVFDVSVEDQQPFSELDIYEQVGHDAALTETVEGVEVTDGTLTISTNTVVHNSKFSGFEIDSVDDGGSEGPPAIGDSDSRPTDPDGDGLYEDLDGNGEVTDADAELFFEHIDDPEMQNNVEAFDFNGNGRLDFDDIVEWHKKNNS